MNIIFTKIYLVVVFFFLILKSYLLCSNAKKHLIIFIGFGATILGLVCYHDVFNTHLILTIQLPVLLLFLLFIYNVMHFNLRLVYKSLIGSYYYQKLTVPEGISFNSMLRVFEARLLDESQKPWKFFDSVYFNIIFSIYMFIGLLSKHYVVVFLLLCSCRYSFLPFLSVFICLLNLGLYTLQFNSTWVEKFEKEWGKNSRLFFGMGDLQSLIRLCFSLSFSGIFIGLTA